MPKSYTGLQLTPNAQVRAMDAFEGRTPDDTPEAACGYYPIAAGAHGLYEGPIPGTENMTIVLFDMPNGAKVRVEAQGRNLVIER
jgi:hypothetical protein